MDTVSETATSAAVHDLYRGSKGRARVVEVPELWFLMLDGTGPPDGAAFRQAVAALNAVDSALRVALQSRGHAVEITPLEACWSVVNPHRAPAGVERSMLDLERASWSWTALIRRPDSVADRLVDEAMRVARAHGAVPGLDQVRYDPFTEGLAVQITHVGPYEAEAESLEVLRRHITDRGFRPWGRHHEIYLSDPVRCAPARLRTILRQPVTPF